MRHRAQAWALALLLGLGPWAACQAGALRYCDRPSALSAEQKDRLLRFGAIIKTALDDSGPVGVLGHRRSMANGVPQRSGRARPPGCCRRYQGTTI